MRFAIITVNPRSAIQLKRMVDKLNNGYFDFYVHIDKAADIEAYKKVLSLHNIFWIQNRVHAQPGGYNAFQAILNSLNQVLETKINYGFVSLTDGGDYPVKSANYIGEFLRHNKGKQFIKYDKEWHTSNQDAIYKYHLTDYNFIGKNLVERYMNTFYKKPAVPQNLPILGRSAYWTISLNCARYVATYIERYRLDKFLKYTQDSEKFVFQSIIMNSPYKDSVINNDNRYTSQVDDEHSPGALTALDIDKINSSDYLFVGNFDTESFPS